MEENPTQTHQKLMSSGAAKINPARAEELMRQARESREAKPDEPPAK
jgi:hypothetical protein